MKKIALFAFNGDPMCFIHVLLNTIDMKDKGYDVALIIEGSATRLLLEIAKEDFQLHGLYQKVKELGLIDCVCKACANKMGTLEIAVEEKLPICGTMNGHPSMASYMEEGYEILIF